ncbi:amidohydrolase [Pilimelia terevasa]|uniref:Amidohydrolase n=1 Tax=Pilimelia terevasa TaxID=53372 RepID=A0A8J3FJI0_9ACTN|nr:amidohydrolase family protein [Pilimelia terevasa]GGK37478.1 amidohydrolase [Pilimelia terevasa]
MSEPSTLYRNAVVHCAVPSASAVVVADGVFSWVGEVADAPRAQRVVDLAGAWLAPAFVDAHVHATDTGLVLSGLDLSGVDGAGALLAAVAAFARGLPAGATVLGHGWDESGWPVGARVPPSAGELDRVSGGRRVYLSQASVHAALVSSALLAEVPASAGGWSSSGLLSREAHHVARRAAFAGLSAGDRSRAQRVMLGRAAASGVAAVHECAGPEISSEADLLGVLALSGDGLPEVYGYWGELGGAVRARELGAVGAAGDLFADGALGSRTAWVSQPYTSGGCGHGYVTAAQVGAHLVECAGVGVQGGFHAIGDAAVREVLAGFRWAADRLGVARVRAGGHRMEHLEVLDRELVAALVEFGVTASVQPVFDAWWGGSAGMYAERLGVARALATNPLGSLHAVGVGLAFGSDAPVTPVDPWGAVAAAVGHHVPAQRLGVRAAFAAHTRGGWRALGPVAGPAARAVREREGTVAPGAPATFAVWEVPGGWADGLPRVGAGVPAPVCTRTVLRGREIYSV